MYNKDNKTSRQVVEKHKNIRIDLSKATRSPDAIDYIVIAMYIIGMILLSYLYDKKH